ncbi:MAG: flavin reductase [Atopobiaceae bacterium]|jgi:flavin reductase (DIM6/NTAB) family NADH-FMN oxidoreductase RutF|nr:flavin reductase [Atopobiaceae bacterium]
MSLHEISPTELRLKPFTAFDRDWALVAAGDEDGFNMMTVSWGGVGTFWQRPVATVYIRSSRYTKTFVDSHDLFSVSFLTPGHRKALNLCGTVSGRDVDKVAKSGLTSVFLSGGQDVPEVPSFAEAALVLICRKALVIPLAPETFIDSDAKDAMYGGADTNNYHTMYIGYVEKAYSSATK